MNKDNTITKWQLIAVIIQTQVGVSIISLPFDVFQKAKTDGWISILVLGLVSQALLVIIWMLCRKFPTSNLFQFSEKIVGKWLGRFINTIYICYAIVVSAYVMLYFTKVFKAWMMELTPKWVLILALMLISFYLVREDLRVIARFHTLIVFSGIFLFILVSYSLTQGNVLYLMPFGSQGISKILQGTHKVFFAIVGFEILLIIYPLVKAKSKDIMKFMSIANVLVIGYYTYITVACLMFFSPEELKLVPEPVLYMLKAYTFHVIERIDLIFLTVWVMAVTTTFSSYIFIASKGIQHLFHSNNYQRIVPFVLIISYLLTFFQIDEHFLAVIGSYLRFYAYVCCGVLPFLLLLVAIVFKKKEGSLSQ